MKIQDKMTEELFQSFSNLLKDKKKKKKDIPLNEPSQLQLHKLVDRYLPYWFIPMLNDEHRNNFYFKMIKKYVPGKTVLEIGSGIGLMSIHAAKCGARHVYACELNPLLYFLAKENIEKSGYSKKITLFLKHSEELILKEDIPSKVDIILSELISDDIFSEDMFPSLKNAQRLLKKNGLYLPGKMTVKGCLVSLKNESITYLSPKNKIYEDLASLAQHRYQRIDLSRLDYQLISSEVELFTIENGFEIKPHLPINFQLKINKKMKYKNTYFCLYFELKDGKNKLANLDVLVKDQHSHWGQLIWKLEDKLDTHDLKIIESNEQLYLLENSKNN